MTRCTAPNSTRNGELSIKQAGMHSHVYIEMLLGLCCQQAHAMCRRASYADMIANCCRARGWARLGAAQLCLGHMRASLSAYSRGLQLDPGNAEMKLGLQLAQGAPAAGPADRRRAIHHT